MEGCIISKHMNESRRRIEEIIDEKKRTGENIDPCETPLDTPKRSDKKLEIRYQREVKP